MNRNLHKAKAVKNDEFYTRYEDIALEVEHYKEQLKGKVVYSNCDYAKSEFVRYFYTNKDRLGIKDFFYSGCDFRSEQSIDRLKQADIVVTNPPFSLFREYISQLMEYEKDFIILGNINALKYKEIWPYIRDNKIRLGPSIKSGDRKFYIPSHYTKAAKSLNIDEDGKRFVRVVGVRWYTTLEHDCLYNDIPLFRKYNPDDYPRYDNIDAIEVSLCKNIPIDYDGLMGVPISIFDKYNPRQFEIVGLLPLPVMGDGKYKYARIIIKRKDVTNGN